MERKRRKHAFLKWTFALYGERTYIYMGIGQRKWKAQELAPPRPSGNCFFILNKVASMKLRENRSEGRFDQSFTLSIWLLDRSIPVVPSFSFEPSLRL